MRIIVSKSTFNRTLWNWNRPTIRIIYWKQTLLIVPYGIETIGEMIGNVKVDLLIVPYGIETVK